MTQKFVEECPGPNRVRCGVPVIAGTDSGTCKGCQNVCATLVSGYCTTCLPASASPFHKPSDCCNNKK